MTLARGRPFVAMTRAPLATRHGNFVVHRFRDSPTGARPLAITCGDVTTGAPVLARVHSSCLTSEGLGACDCDCAEQLDAALAAIAQRGRGALFYLLQEGRGAGFIAKALDRMLVQASGNRLTTFEAYARLGLPPDQRSYAEVAAMMRLLGVGGGLRLLSNNPEKVAAVRSGGVAVQGTEPLRIPASAYSQHYLAAKARAGHTIETPADIHPVCLPQRVPLLHPEPLATAPHLLRVAAYLLPVRRHATVWLRLHLYVDTTTERQHIVLTYGEGHSGSVLVRLQRETLLDHFRLRTPRFRRGWDDAVTRLVAHGRGIVVLTGARELLPGETLGALVQAHLGERPGIVLALDEDGAADLALLRHVLGPARLRDQA